MTGVLLLLFLLVMVAAEAKERAILEIVLYEQEANGDVKTYEFELSGHFTNAGARGSAEGQIVQIHPMGLCNNGDFEESIGSHTDYGWVVVVKLELPQFDPDPCMSVYNKAKRAIQRGATAVVFDVTDNQRAAKQLRTSTGPALPRPVVIVRGKEADKLMNIVNTQKQARARIKALATESVHRTNNKEFFNMGIFLAFFVLFCIVCLTVILKLKWRQRTRQLSPTEVAKRTLAKLETRRYKVPASRRKYRSTSLCSETDSGAETCAVCLEEYKDTQDIRILPCCHEFHRSCVDPWLISNRTCPLCLYNILECPADNEGSPCSTPEPGHHGNTIPLPPHPNIINNNIGHLNNLNMTSVAMATPSSSANLVYPSSSQIGYGQYNAQRILPADRYYAVQPGRYQTFSHYTGLEYNQIETIPMSTSMAFASHGNPPHYGLPRYSAYHQAPSLGGSAGGTVHVSSARTGNMVAVSAIAGKRAVLSAKHNIASGSSVSRKVPESGGTGRVPRPGRARPVVPVNHYTSSESDMDLYQHPIPPATHQVILHQQQKAVMAVVPPDGGSDSDSCSCGAMSNGSNVDCSNRSTLGSSDLPSDVSSFDSYAYRCRTPEEVHPPSPGSAAPEPLATSPTQAHTHLKSACVGTHNHVRTHYSLQRRKTELSPQQSDSMRHSCHGDVYKHGSVEAMLPPTLKSKLKQSKKANIVQHISLSSDNSVSSLDTTGMSPIVSDWYPSSGSESNEQICDGCQTKMPTNTLQSPSSPIVILPEADCGQCSGDEADDSECCHSDSEDLILKSEILPVNISSVYTDHNRTMVKTSNIPAKTHYLQQRRHPHLQNNASQISKLDSMHSKLANAAAERKQKTSESSPRVSPSKKCQPEVSIHHHGSHQVAALSDNGCHTCATLRSSLKMVRASMLHGDHRHHITTSHVTTVSHVTTSGHVTAGRAEVILVSTSGTASVSTTTSTNVNSQASHMLRHQHRTSGSTSSTADATKDGVVRRPSVVMFTEPEGACITIPADQSEHLGCLSVV